MSAPNTKSPTMKPVGIYEMEGGADLRPEDQPTAVRAVRGRTIEVLEQCAQEISRIPGDGVGSVLASALRKLTGRIRTGELMSHCAVNAGAIGPPDPEDVGVLEIAAGIVSNHAAPNANSIRASGTQAMIESVLEKLRQIRVELKPYRRADWTRVAGMIRAIEYAIRLGCCDGKGDRVPGILGAVGLGKEEVS
jgi:hypothetical protein